MTFWPPYNPILKYLQLLMHLLNTGTSTLSDASVKYNVRKIAV
jgi:hypothetical protein